MLLKMSTEGINQLLQTTLEETIELFKRRLGHNSKALRGLKRFRTIRNFGTGATFLDLIKPRTGDSEDVILFKTELFKLANGLALNSTSAVKASPAEVKLDEEVGRLGARLDDAVRLAKDFALNIKQLQADKAAKSAAGVLELQEEWVQAHVDAMDLAEVKESLERAKESLERALAANAAQGLRNDAKLTRLASLAIEESPDIVILTPHPKPHALSSEP